MLRVDQRRRCDLFTNRYSTGITYQLIPRATADDIPIHSMGYGRTSAKNGKIFSHVFNYPANYWNGASIAINYLLDESTVVIIQGQEELRWSITTRLTAKSRSVRWKSCLRNMATSCCLLAGGPPRSGAEIAMAANPPRSPGLCSDVGLGRDEPGCHSGSREHPFPDGKLHRHLVVRV